MFALIRFASSYFGVDISRKNLDEAERMIKQEGFNNFQKVFLEKDPLAALDQIPQPIDVFLSTAVFQHFPSCAYGVEVLNTLARVTRPNAIGLVQIRFENGNPKYKSIESLDEYEKRHITATSYSLSEFWDICVAAGFEVLFVSDLRTANNYATFSLRRKAGAG